MPDEVGSYQNPDNFPQNSDLGVQESGSDETGEEEENRKLITKLNNWFQESEQFMRVKRDRWKKNLELYENIIEVNTPDGAVQIKINLVLAAIETEKPIISDHLPTFDIKPEGRNDVFWADILQKTKNKMSEQAELRDSMLDTIDTSLIYSDGLTEIIPEFDVILDVMDTGEEGADIGREVSTENDLKGLGVQERKVLTGFKANDIDLFTWFPDKFATGFELGVDCRFHIFANPMHPDDVERIWDIQVPAEGYLDEYKVWHVMEGESSGERRSEQVLVKEAWFIDTDKRFPKGRHVIWIGSHTILLQEAIPYPRIPIFHIKNYGHKNYLFGTGEPELIKEIVATLNEVVSATAESVKKIGAPPRKVRSAWRDNRERDITNLADEEIIVNDMDDVKWEVLTNAVAGGTLEFIELLMRLADVVTGIHDALQGKRPAAITAASAILALQEAAQSRVRYKNSKYYAKYIREMGTFITWLIQNFDQDVIEIRDELAGQYDFQEVDPSGKYDARGIQPGEDEFDENSAMTLKDSRMDVTVVTGTRVPTGRYAEEEIAREKLIAGIYGIEEYAINSNEPNKKQLIEGYRKRNGIQALQEMMEGMEKANQKFEKLVNMALRDPLAFKSSIEEQNMGELLAQYPLLLGEYSFKILPDEVKNRVWLIIKNQAGGQA